ncbi:transposase [Caldichromatium japonicum]|uniref:transposase n=1 Tax=Caldichromatium japonicum TaxID=2699430 RepID=UPI003CCD2337
MYDVYHARPQDCAACPLRERCLSKPSASRRYLSVSTTQPPNLLDEMKAKIDSPEGKKIYARRLAMVEPVFANICVHKHMNRFTLRSKAKVDVQWRLYALVHNIGKICVFWWAEVASKGERISLAGPVSALKRGSAGGQKPLHPRQKGFFDSFVGQTGMRSLADGDLVAVICGRCAGECPLVQCLPLTAASISANSSAS